MTGLKSLFCFLFLFSLFTTSVLPILFILFICFLFFLCITSASFFMIILFIHFLLSGVGIISYAPLDVNQSVWTGDIITLWNAKVIWTRSAGCVCTLVQSRCFLAQNVTDGRINSLSCTILYWVLRNCPLISFYVLCWKLPLPLSVHKRACWDHLAIFFSPITCSCSNGVSVFVNKYTKHTFWHTCVTSYLKEPAAFTKSLHPLKDFNYVPESIPW